MRKIGELKGKPIIEGNPNEIKNNQIHAKTDNKFIILSERKQSNLEIISGGLSSDKNFMDYMYFNFTSDNFNTLRDILSLYVYDIEIYSTVLPIYIKRYGNSSDSKYILQSSSAPSGYTSNLISIAIPKYIIGEIHKEDGETYVKFSLGKYLELFSFIAERNDDISLDSLKSYQITAEQFWNE